MVASNTAQQNQVLSVPAKKKRTTKAKQPKQHKAEDEVAVKLEPDTAKITTTSRTQANSKAPKKKQSTKVLKAGAAASQTQGAGTMAAGEQQAPNMVQSSTTALTTRPSVDSDNGSDIIVPLPSTRLRFRLSISRSSFRALPEHLQALGSVVWDAEGFQRMELSALPWIAGVAQQIKGPCDLVPNTEHESVFGELDLHGVPIFAGHNNPGAEPELPCGPSASEVTEDVCVCLHTDRPLPTTFLRALGRTVSIRRDGESAVGQDGLV
ncbi:hypothetical protein PYCCODRAFT_1440377, partial [Trametes coccinea BRFM310]